MFHQIREKQFDKNKRKNAKKNKNLIYNEETDNDITPVILNKKPELSVISNKKPELSVIPNKKPELSVISNKKPELSVSNKNVDKSNVDKSNVDKSNLLKLKKCLNDLDNNLNQISKNESKIPVYKDSKLKYKCDCGCIILVENKTRHLKSKLHNKKMRESKNL